MEEVARFGRVSLTWTDACWLGRISEAVAMPKVPYFCEYYGRYVVLSRSAVVSSKSDRISKRGVMVDLMSATFGKKSWVGLSAYAIEDKMDFSRSQARVWNTNENEQLR